MAIQVELSPKKISANKIETIDLRLISDRTYGHITLSYILPNSLMPKGKTRFNIPKLKPGYPVEKEIKLIYRRSINEKTSKDIEIKLVYRDSSNRPDSKTVTRSIDLVPGVREQGSTELPEINIRFPSNIEGVKNTYKRISCEITNEGKVNAKDLKVKVDGNISGELRKVIDGLEPGESRKVFFTIKPYSSGVLPLSLILFYSGVGFKTKRKEIQTIMDIKDHIIDEKKSNVFNIHEDHREIHKDNSTKVFHDNSKKIKDSIVLNKGRKDKKNPSSGGGEIKNSVILDRGRNFDNEDVGSRDRDPVEEIDIDDFTHCSNCGKKIKKTWNFCPYCNAHRKEAIDDG